MKTVQHWLVRYYCDGDLEFIFLKVGIFEVLVELGLDTL